VKSLEVQSIFRVRDAHRAEDFAQRSYNAAPTKENWAAWDRAIRRVQSARLRRNVATRVTIARARHALSLAEIRGGVDAYAEYRIAPPGSCASIANQFASPFLRQAEECLGVVVAEPRPLSLSLDEVSLGDRAAHAPPRLSRCASRAHTPRRLAALVT
jgi:hypothetical protein